MPAREELAIHLSDGRIGTVEIIIADESMTLTIAFLWITCNFGTNNHSEVAKSLIEQFFIDLRVQIADEYVGSNILGPFILGGFINFDRFPVEFDHMHDLDRIISILFTLKFDKSIPLMLIGDLVSWDVHIHHWPALRKQLPQDILVYLLVDVARIHCGLLVALVEGGNQRHSLIIIISRS